MQSRLSTSTLAERLGRTLVLSALDPESLLQIARAGARRTLARKQRLFGRGEASDALALVLSGRLDIVRDTEEGERVILRSLGPDALVGLSSVAGAPHSADVVAGEPAEVLVVPGTVLRALLSREPTLALRAMAHLAALLSDLTDEVEELRIHDLEERVRRRLVRLGRGRRQLALTHDELAAQVCATRANVSRALKGLEERGALRRHRGRIELLRIGERR